MPEYGVTQPPVAVSGTTYVPPSPAYVVNNWYLPEGLNTGGSFAGTANRVSLMPLEVRGKTITVSDLGVFFNAASAGGLTQLFIYANNASTGNPTGVPLAAVQISTSATGSVSGAITSGTGVLAPGMYWIGHTPDSTGATATIAFASNNGSKLAAVVGHNSLAGIITASNLCVVKTTTVTFTSGTFPDLTAASFSVVAGIGGPLVAFKISAVA